MKRETELTTKKNTPLKVHKKTASHPRWPQPVVQSVEERSKPKRNQSNATGALSDKNTTKNNTTKIRKQYKSVPKTIKQTVKQKEHDKSHLSCSFCFTVCFTGHDAFCN